MKCNQFLFIKNTFKKNFGFIISIIFLFFRIIFYFSFFKTRLNGIKNYVEKEMKKYHYDIEENSNNANAHINQNNNNFINQNTERENINNIEKKEIQNELGCTENEPEKDKISNIFVYQRENNNLMIRMKKNKFKIRI